MESLEALEKRLKELERSIRETSERLPAHSVKPPVMMDLLELEDEYDAMVEKIKALSRGLREGIA